MRPILVTLLVALAALAGTSGGASSAAQGLTVTVTGSAPAPRGPGRTPSGRRDYAVTFRVGVQSDRQCASLVVGYSYVPLFDGRRSLAASASDAFETTEPAAAADFAVHAAAGAGDVVSFTARASCEDAAGNVVTTSERVAAKVAVPAHSCDTGPLHVFAARGTVRREDLRSGASVRVRAGHLLWSGYSVAVARRSRIVYGARECHRLRVAVAGPASFVPGDYAARSYGTSTLLQYGATADFRGDQHSGGVETPNAAALPRGARTAPSKLARFVVTTDPRRAGRVTRVRVLSGAVYVAGRTPGRGVRYGTPVVVRRGETAFVRGGNATSPARVSKT